MVRITFIKSQLLSPPPQTFRAIVYACLMVATPTAIRAALDPIVSDTTFVAYYPFVVLAALLMSWQQAAAIALASGIAANFLFMQPRYVVFGGATDTISTIFFVLCSMLIVAVGQTLRRSVQDLEDVRLREAHLNRELQHRVKNTLAVVQALAVQTLRDIPHANGSLKKLQGRIRALADANEILRDGRWEECRLPGLPVRALEPFNARGAITLYGPECSLPEESCVPLVLALHELATNAVKYGALSVPDGSVLVSWSVSDNIGLDLQWIEGGGPLVSQPVKHGLGSKLLRPQNGLKEVNVRFDPNGVRCELRLAGVRVLQPEEKDPSSLPPVTLYSEAVPSAAR